MNILEMKQLAAELLKLSDGEVEQYSGVIKELDALYVSVPIKGGASLIVGRDGKVLYASSAISYVKHIEAYKSGKRTPLESFKR